MRGIEHLHPKAKEKALELLRLCKENGLNCIITETFRSVDEQNKLYRQGRTINGIKYSGNIVTNARGDDYSSGHMWGVAFDFAEGDGTPYDSDKFFAEVGRLGESIELVWGGRWRTPDRPHFELREYMPNNSTKTLKATYGTPERFKATWGSSVENCQFGSSGAVVKKIQEKLRIPVDGIFGKQTHDSVVKFQKDCGLVADGIVGTLTMKALQI